MGEQIGQHLVERECARGTHHGHDINRRSGCCCRALRWRQIVAAEGFTRKLHSVIDDRRSDDNHVGPASTGRLLIEKCDLIRDRFKRKRRSCCPHHSQRDVRPRFPLGHGRLRQRLSVSNSPVTLPKIFQCQIVVYIDDGGHGIRRRCNRLLRCWVRTNNRRELV